MSGEGEDDRDDPEPEDSADDSRGFRLEMGLRPLSDVLGNLVEVKKTDVPASSEETVEWEYVDEGESDENGDDSRRRPRESELRRPDDSTGQRPNRSERRENEGPRRERKKRTRPVESGAVRSDTRREDGEFVATADVFGVGKDELTVGIDPETNELVIGANDTALERVSLPWESVEATTVRFNNGVLEVRLRNARA